MRIRKYDADALLETIRLLARVIADDLMLTVAGDAYIFEGSTNDVDSLKEALVDFDTYRIENTPEHP